MSDNTSLSKLMQDGVPESEPDHTGTDIELTPLEASRVGRFISRVRVGMNSGVPMICRGEKCPFHDACPLFQVGKAPEGSPCPFEDNFVDEWTRQKFEALPDLSSENALDRAYISQLVRLDILDWRIAMLQATPEHAGLTTLDVKDFDVDSGEPVAFELKESPLLNTSERIHNQRVRILRDIMATRYDQMKVLSSAARTAAAQNLANRLTSVRQAIESQRKSFPTDSPPSETV